MIHAPLRLGVSTGVRDPRLMESFGPLVDWVPVHAAIGRLPEAPGLCGVVLSEDPSGARASHAPLLPVADAGRLRDARAREHFVARAVAYGRLAALFGSRWTMGDVVRFHSVHKLTLMAQSPAAYRALGRLVAGGRSLPRAEFQARYAPAFMAALATPATPGRHANALQHMLGYFSHTLDRESRAALLGLIADLAGGRAPLAAPLALVAHHVRRCDVGYLAGQVYLHPHPAGQDVRRHS